MDTENTLRLQRTASRKKDKKSLIWKIPVGVITAILAVLLIFVSVLTIAEYRPKDVETVPISGNSTKQPKVGDSFTILTVNTGFAALDDEHDLFTNGGVEGLNDNKDEVKANIAGMNGIIADTKADIVLLQEVDFKAARSFYIDEAAEFSKPYGGMSTTAMNYNALFVPLPLKSPMGYVKAGLQTITQFKTENAKRISLPNTHSWPESTCQLKRCILAQEIPLDGSDKKLVIVNVHLEAYSGEEGKAAQSKVIHDFIAAEYEKGNYVIVGGDFNQTVPGADMSKYDNGISNPYFSAPVIDTTGLPEGFKYVCDDSVPTCRFADSAYNHDWSKTELFVLDGFLISPNIQVNFIETLNKEFEFTDHNPVKMNITLLDK